MDKTENKNRGGMIVLLIFLLICSGLGIAAFVMSLRGCNKDGFETTCMSPQPSSIPTGQSCTTDTECGVYNICNMRTTNPSPTCVKNGIAQNCLQNLACSKDGKDGKDGKCYFNKPGQYINYMENNNKDSYLYPDLNSALNPITGYIDPGSSCPNFPQPTKYHDSHFNYDEDGLPSDKYSQAFTINNNWANFRDLKLYVDGNMITSDCGCMQMPDPPPPPDSPPPIPIAIEKCGIVFNPSPAAAPQCSRHRQKPRDCGPRGKYGPGPCKCDDP